MQVVIDFSYKNFGISPAYSYLCRKKLRDMPRKKDGMPFEVHPTPAIGKDGKNIVYAKPAMRVKLTMQGVEDFCSRNYGLRFGELSRAFDVFLRAAGELMAMGYRVDTPIGSFAPRLALTREITDPDEVTARDVRFNGVDYQPGKHWNEELQKWNNGFRRIDNGNSLELLADKKRLDEVLQECLKRYDGYVTVGLFAHNSGLTYYSARKQLNQWTEGDNPRLLKTRRGQEFIYTEI